MPASREEKNAQKRKSYHKNKEKNREKINQRQENYRKNNPRTRKGHIGTLVDKWSADKVKYSEGDLRDLADKYFKTDNCELCNRDIAADTSKISLRNMDHNHSTNYFRWVCCRSCNIRLGKTDREFRCVMKELKFVCRLPPVFKLT
tara:strand:- start:447 stop:884 length:438 start_codon:yes stop_codon:yes gene_type:complete